MKKIIALILLTSNVSYALEVDQSVPFYLIKDRPAPFTGYLFSVDKEATVRLGIKERDYYKAVTESQDKAIDFYKKNETIYTDRIDQYKKQNDSLSQALYSSQQTSAWEKLIYFGLGVLVSGVAFVTFKKISQ